MKTIITIEIDGEEVNVSTEKKESEKVDGLIEHNDLSQYARFFDDGCVGWTNNPEYNRAFLAFQQNYANDLLKVKGHLLLNEVYDMLGIIRSKAGCVVGWIYDENNPIGDNYIDFGLFNKRNKDFINGYESVAILDFNVDGVIIDRI